MNVRKRIGTRPALWYYQVGELIDQYVNGQDRELKIVTVPSVQAVRAIEALIQAREIGTYDVDKPIVVSQVYRNGHVLCPVCRLSTTVDGYCDTCTFGGIHHVDCQKLQAIAAFMRHSDIEIAMRRMSDLCISLQLYVQSAYHTTEDPCTCGGDDLLDHFMSQIEED